LKIQLDKLLNGHIYRAATKVFGQLGLICVRSKLVVSVYSAYAVHILNISRAR